MTSALIKQDAQSAPQHLKDLSEEDFRDTNIEIPGISAHKRTSLDQVIREIAALGNTTSPNDTVDPKCLNNLALLYGAQFEYTKMASDSDRAIDIARTALAATSLGGESRAATLSILSALFIIRFTISRGAQNLTRAIEFAKESIEATSSTDPLMSLRRRNLKLLLHPHLFISRIKSHSDLDSHISAVTMAAEVCTIADADAISMLGSLIILLVLRKDSNPILANIEPIIDVCEQRLAMISKEHHAEEAETLGILADSAYDRYKITRSIENLDKSIEATKKVLVAENSGHFAWLERLDLLIDLMRYRHEASKASSEEYLELATRLTRLRQEMPQTSGLAIAVSSTRFIEHLRQWCTPTLDLKKYRHTLWAAETLLAVSPHDYPQYHIMRLASGLYSTVYQNHSGSIEDLHRAIDLTTQCVDIERYRDSNNSNVGLRELLGLESPFDAIDSLNKIRNALIEFRSENDNNALPGNPSNMVVLAKLLQERYRRTARKSDIIFSIKILIHILTSEGARDYRVLRLLSAGYRRRYEGSGQLAEYLNHNIEFTTMVSDSITISHPLYCEFLSELGHQLWDQYKLEKNQSDLQKAISVMGEVLKATDVGNPKRCGYLCKQRLNLFSRFLLKRDQKDLELSRKYSKESWKCPDRLKTDRIRAGAMFTHGLIKQSKWENTYEIYRKIASLFTTISSQSLRHVDAYLKLQHHKRLGSDAAAISLSAGIEPSEVLRTLELYRGVILSTMLETRVDFSDLQTQHPNLAASLVSRREQLNSFIEVDSVLKNEAKYTKIRESTRLHSEAEETYKTLLKEICAQPGFADFLEPLNASEMMATAKLGPIAVINISPYRCNAFLITKDSVTSTELHKLNYDEIESKITQMRSNNKFKA
ncbi:hypothetical protein TWF694_004405 [Orbilia ellipsospora]|uniref:Uncharacterized protein n=1 Tax=Orbilia ellipsospora TaxID=2528407 RepID=A0AAV9WV13_9PEZI